MSFKKIYIDNLGCAKNQVNAEIMVASLSEAGYRLSEAADADVIIVNSCGFVESAKKEAIQHFFSAKNNYKAKIVFAGCMAERYGDELKELLTEADGLYAGKPEVVGSFVEQLQGNPIIKAAAGPLKRKERFSFNGSAYLKIAEGCNNGCRYCAIPLIKGPLISRNSAEIINEFNFLLEDGVKEINLIAQDLASYGFDKGQSLYQLLKELSKIDKTFYARLLYLHPDLFPLEILELIANDSRFLPYFDIPFQHAGSKVLKNMGRNGDSASYLKLIDAIRTKLPQAVIRSTFLFGFPGETKEDFNDVLNFIHKAKLDYAAGFTYSREEGTAAYKEAGNKNLAVSSKLAKQRLGIFNEQQQIISRNQLKRYLGHSYDALIEEPIKGSNLYLGRIYSQAPEVDGLTLIESAAHLTAGNVVKVTITGTTGAIDLTATVDETL